MNKFMEIAQKELSLSRVMEGREKVDTAALIGGTYTIDEFDFITVNDKNTGEPTTYACVHFKELPNKFYNGGALIRKVCEAFTADYDGDIEAASDALKADGGVPFAFSSGRTSTGRNLTVISVAH